MKQVFILGIISAFILSCNPDKKLDKNILPCKCVMNVFPGSAQKYEDTIPGNAFYVDISDSCYEYENKKYKRVTISYSDKKIIVFNEYVRPSDEGMYYYLIRASPTENTFKESPLLDLKITDIQGNNIPSAFALRSIDSDEHHRIFSFQLLAGQNRTIYLKMDDTGKIIQIYQGGFAMPL
jgi:hypothetical protein